MLRLHVTSIQNPGPDDGQDLPVVHFKGVSRSLDDSFDNNANSNIRGKSLASSFPIPASHQGQQLTGEHSAQ